MRGIDYTPQEFIGHAFPQKNKEEVLSLIKKALDTDLFDVLCHIHLLSKSEMENCDNYGANIDWL